MITIFSKFLSIEPEKQERIINSALKEFARKGFSLASTNQIISEAKISKGILFYYFKNKKELFLFLYDYSLDTFCQDFMAKIDLLEKDIFIRWRQIAQMKIELFKKYPDLFKFILKANVETSDEVKVDLDQRNTEFITKNLQKVLEDIDTSKFKPGIDIKKAIDTIVWTIEGFTAKEQEKVKQNSLDFDYDQILMELDSYLDLLRNCFYQ